MPKYMVHMKLQGHASIVVEARNEADAMSLAVKSITFEHIDDWDVIKRDAEVQEIEDSR